MNDHDNDKRGACPRFNGMRGEQYLRWRRDVKMHLNAVSLRDDDNSAWKTALGIDQGGDAPGAPPINGPPQAQAAANKKSAARQSMLHRELYNCMEDERLKTLIGDLDVNPVNGQGSGRRAWLLIERECSEEMTDLMMRTIMTKFNLASMRTSEGISENTITDFNRHQNATVARL